MYTLVLLIPLALLLLAYWFGSGRSALLRRRARESYLNQDVPHFVRVAVPMAPVAAPGAIAFGLLPLLPPDISRWFVIPAVLLVELYVVLAYRVPPPVMPQWMREEMESGALPVARPERLDWVLLWMTSPILVLGPFALLYPAVTTSAQ